jgi:hypothetical protein
MRGRRVRDAMSKERHVCARRRDGEPAGSRKTGGVTITPAHPRRAQTRFFPWEYVEDFSAPRTKQMLVHRLSQ